MEKKSISVKDLLYMVLGIITCVCMLMNWFPVELNLGFAQLDEVFGTVNPFTLYGILSKLESALGIVAGLLPEGFHELKMSSMILLVCAAATVGLYATSIILGLRKKEKYKDLLSYAAAAAAIATAVGFCALIARVYSTVGGSLAESTALSVVLGSSCKYALIGAVVSVLFVGEGFTELVANLVAAVLDWAKVLIDNVGYLVSDVAGAYVGLRIIMFVMAMTDSVILAVISGLAVAGVVAGGCCFIVSRVFPNAKKAAAWN